MSEPLGRDATNNPQENRPADEPEQEERLERVDGRAVRPRKSRTVEELERAIERYFAEARHPVATKDGVAYVEGPYTMSGLALALGFKSRRELLEYRGRPGRYSDAIARARMRIQEWEEAQLFDREGSRGAQFSLINNFPGEGWSAKQDISVRQTVTIELDGLLPTEEAKRRLEQRKREALLPPSAEGNPL